MVRTLLIALTLVASLSAQTVAERKALTEKEPQNGFAWFQLGDALIAENQAADAVPAFQKARQFGFQPPVSAERVVRALVAAKNNDGALQMLERMGQNGFAAVALVESDAALAPIRSDARYTAAIALIRGNSAPCENREQFKQLDFWVGDWAVYTKAGKLAGVNKIEKMLNGCLILENWVGVGGIVGRSMNFYDQSRQQWRQIWVDGSGIPVITAGGLEADKSMRLAGTGKNTEGEYLQRLTFSRIDNGKVHQLWEKSKDKGTSWTPLFDGVYQKRTTEIVEAKAQTACAAPEHRKFDFWIGDWDVQSPGATAPNPPRSSIQKIVDGCVIFENWMPPGGGDGKSFNFYSPLDKKWHQIWIAAGAGVLDMAGDFEGKALHYEGVVQGNGRTALQKLTFTPLDDGRVHQYWQQSIDDGKTWTVAFDGYYNRRK